MKFPWWLRRLYDAWMLFEDAIGTVVSTIILTLFWILIVGPYALVWKLTTKRSESTDSYWIDVSAEKHNYQRQF